MSSWPGHGSLLLPGVNDSWNEFQKFSKGKAVISLDWKVAKEKLRKEYEEYKSRGGPIVRQPPNLSRNGATLSIQQVIDIFNLKTVGKKERLGSALARQHGVSPKAIRDIWKGRTWSDITSQVGHGDGCTDYRAIVEHLKASRIASPRLCSYDVDLLCATCDLITPLDLVFPLVPADSPCRHSTTFQHDEKTMLAMLELLFKAVRGGGSAADFSNQSATNSPKPFDRYQHFKSTPFSTRPEHGMLIACGALRLQRAPHAPANASAPSALTALLICPDSSVFDSKLTAPLAELDLLCVLVHGLLGAQGSGGNDTTRRYLRVWTAPAVAELVAWETDHGINNQGKHWSWGITAEQYDEAVRSEPARCPLLLAGDHRSGQQLLDQAGEDGCQTLASLSFAAAAAAAFARAALCAVPHATHLQHLAAALRAARRPDSSASARCDPHSRAPSSSSVDSAPTHVAAAAATAAAAGGSSLAFCDPLASGRNSHCCSPHTPPPEPRVAAEASGVEDAMAAEASSMGADAGSSFSAGESGNWMRLLRLPSSADCCPTSPAPDDPALAAPVVVKTEAAGEIPGFRAHASSYAPALDAHAAAVLAAGRSALSPTASQRGGRGADAGWGRRGGDGDDMEWVLVDCDEAEAAAGPAGMWGWEAGPGDESVL